MNSALLIGEVAAVAGLVAGQLYDCYTTYVGIYVQKTAVVETSTWWKKLITGNKTALLTVKPLVCLGAGIGLSIAANSVHTGQAIDSVVSLGAVIGVSVVGAIMGLAGRGNAAANKAALSLIPVKKA